MSYLYGKKKNKNKEKNVRKPVKKNNYHGRMVKKQKQRYYLTFLFTSLRSVESGIYVLKSGINKTNIYQRTTSTPFPGMDIRQLIDND